MAEVSYRNSYGNILKSIGLFGGTKVFQILIGIIKNKILAVLLGPAGMGIAGMITSTTGLVNSMTGFGLHTSSVRSIAKATESRDEHKIAIVTTVLRRLVILTGLLGTLVTFFMAPLLSQWSFGNDDYTAAFRLVSVILFTDQLYVGQIALMQGTFHYRYMAKAAVWGSVLGLVVSVPLYYIWHFKAIVPVIILTSLTQLILSWHYSHKIKTENIMLNSEEFRAEAKVMLGLGFAIALTGVVGTGQTYLLRTFISRIGSIKDVGLYTAGITIATQYINVILQAMGSDYSPRLAAISDNKDEFIETINRQAKLMLTIVTPLIIPFFVYIRILIKLLYSSEFLDITGMIEWMMLGMFFRATSWCLSYSMVARGESKKFFWNETLSVIYGFAFTIIGYKLYSFSGMGIAFCVNYVVYTIHMYILCRRNFGFKFNTNVFKLSTLYAMLLIVSFVVVKLMPSLITRYVVGTCFVVLIGAIAYHFLSTMVPIKNKIVSLIHKK